MLHETNAKSIAMRKENRGGVSEVLKQWNSLISSVMEVTSSVFISIGVSS